jgi:hypothetical protein
MKERGNTSAATSLLAIILLQSRNEVCLISRDNEATLL